LPDVTLEISMYERALAAVAVCEATWMLPMV
jgi:hypothetical protein